MDIFLDTADIEQIKKFTDAGMIDGVTTNPSIIASSGREFIKVIAEICEICPGPVSAEVISLNKNEMLEEAHNLIKKINKPNLCIKLPLTFDGLAACKNLSQNGIMTNVTLCFSALQALNAAKAGATFVSPFVGRLDDISQDGMELIEDIKIIFSNYNFQTKILTASIRHQTHILQAAKIGSDVVTIPPSLMEKMISHPLTQKGIDKFLSDWKKANQSITS